MDFAKGSDANVQSCPSDTLGAALTELIKCTLTSKQNQWEARTYVFNDIL